MDLCFFLFRTFCEKNKTVLVPSITILPLICGDEILKNTKQEKVLGATLDNKLNFATHLSNITENANKKFNAWTRVQIYLTTDQKSLYFPTLLSCSLPTVRWYGCFAQNVSFAKQTIYMSGACAWYSKTTNLNLKDSSKECKWKLSSPELHWISFDWGL